MLLKQDCISASLCSSISILVTHSVLTILPKNLWSPSFWRKYVFPHSVLRTTNMFPWKCHKLTYFQLPFINSFLADFKLFICSNPCEFNRYSSGGWAYIDLNTLNLSHKWTAQLSCAKNPNIFSRMLVWSCSQYFSFSSLLLFNKKCPNGRDTLPSWKWYVYHLNLEIDSI